MTKGQGSRSHRSYFTYFVMTLWSVTYFTIKWPRTCKYMEMKDSDFDLFGKWKLFGASHLHFQYRNIVLRQIWPWLSTGSKWYSLYVICLQRKEREDGKVPQIHSIMLHETFTHRDLVNLLESTGEMDDGPKSTQYLP